MQHAKASEEFLTTNVVALMIQRSPARVRQLERAGVLPARRASGGLRLFNRVDVEKYLAARDASKEAA